MTCVRVENPGFSRREPFLVEHFSRGSFIPFKIDRVPYFPSTHTHTHTFTLGRIHIATIANTMRARSLLRRE